MSNIRYLEGQCDLFWNRVKDDFAGFERPRIFPAQAIRRDAPIYLLRYIDEDPTSYYMFLAGDPLKHQDISRDKACEFFDRFFYEHMRMPSSFDVQAGGEYSREQAIDKEVLPAKTTPPTRRTRRSRKNWRDGMLKNKNRPITRPKTAGNRKTVSGATTRTS